LTGLAESHTLFNPAAPEAGLTCAWAGSAGANIIAAMYSATATARSNKRSFSSYGTQHVQNPSHSQLDYE